MKTAHIYLVTCSANGKVYVGKTVQKIERRWSRHILDAKKGLDLFFYRAILKYGTDAFQIEEISLVGADRADDLERFWIEYFQSMNPAFGYNSTIGGEGFPHSDEEKRKISESCKAWWTPERRLEASIARKGRLTGEKNPMFGKGLSGEANGMYGKKMSEDSRQKMRDSSQHLSGAAHPMFGKHHTEEARQKIAASQIGVNRRPDYRPSEETKQKISASMKRAYEENRRPIKQNFQFANSERFPVETVRRS